MLPVPSAPANTCLSRVTLAVEDWIDREAPKEGGEDSCSPPAPHHLHRPRASRVAQGSTSRAKGWTTWDVTTKPPRPWDSPESRSSGQGGGLRAGKQPTGLDPGCEGWLWWKG